MAAGGSGARKTDDTHTKTERFTAVKRSVFIFIPAAKKPAPAQRQPVPLSPIFTLTALLYFPTTRILEGLPDFPRDVPDTARDGCRAASAQANTV